MDYQENAALKGWISLANPRDKEALALKCNTNMVYLYILSSGRRTASYFLAVRLIKEMAKINEQKEMLGQPLLPVLQVEDLCPAAKQLEE